MSHRQKHKHKSRHRTHPVKSASLMKPQSILPTAATTPPELSPLKEFSMEDSIVDVENQSVPVDLS